MKTITLTFGVQTLVCKVEVPPYRKATHEQPEEGGIKDFEIKSIVWGCLNVTSLLMELCSDIINEKIMETLENQ